MTFLSPEWVASLTERAVSGALDDIDVCVQHLVTGDEPVEYWMRIADGAITTGMGRVDAPDVVITCDRASAAALADGTANAQELFRAGQLRLRGDVRKLIAWSSAIHSSI